MKHTFRKPNAEEDLVYGFAEVDKDIAWPLTNEMYYLGTEL